MTEARLRTKIGFAMRPPARLLFHSQSGPSGRFAGSRRLDHVTGVSEGSSRALGMGDGAATVAEFDRAS
jgi:hypothetical protein